MKFSEHYDACLKDAKRHHATSKTWSGKLVVAHAPFIKAVLRHYGCETLLDYGCGKGIQYRGPVVQGQTLRDYWGVEIVLYDPAVPEYDAEPNGWYDAVLMTHTMGTIPTCDYPLLFGRLHEIAGAGRIIYIGEKIGPTRKTVVADHVARLLPEGWQTPEWLDAIGQYRGKADVIFAARTEEHGEGREMRHYLLRALSADWVPLLWNHKGDFAW